MNLFGNVTCTHCQLDSRFLFEKEEGTNFYMLGDSWEGSNGYLGDVPCDYCQSDIPLYVVTKENVLSAFLNEEQFEAYQTGTKEIEKAKEHQGLEFEKKKNLRQFHETFTSEFNRHPYAKGKVLRIGTKKWKVERVYKKEDTEKDPVKRLFSGVYDEYCYIIKDEENEEKWLSVVDLPHNNAVLTPEAPSLRASEKIMDVSDTLFQTKQMYVQTLSDNYEVKGYEYLSGVRLLVFNKEEDIEMDIFDDDLEAALKQIEEVFALEES